MHTRQKLTLIVLSLLLVSAITTNCSAQERKPAGDAGHIFAVTLLKIPLGDVQSFMDFWQNTWMPLEKADPDLISSKVLRHRYGPTDYSVFLIQEFKDLAGMEASRNREEGSLQRRAATDQAAAEAMRNFGRFVNGHVDYILFGPDSASK